MAIGQDLLNVPMGQMIREMAFAIADAQQALDESSIEVAEMMGGLRTITEPRGGRTAGNRVTFEDSRVFFGYEYMTLQEAVVYAAMEDAVSGTFDAERALNLLEVVRRAAEALGVSSASSLDETNVGSLPEAQREALIRVPVRASMLELGFAPTFYQFVDTIIEVKIAIRMTRETERTVTRGSRGRGLGVGGFRRGGSSSSFQTGVGLVATSSQVDATYASKYSYSAEGASLLRTKLVPVPPPAVLEDRVRALMDSEAQRRLQALEARRVALGLDEDDG